MEKKSNVEFIQDQLKNVLDGLRDVINTLQNTPYHSSQFDKGLRESAQQIVSINSKLSQAFKLEEVLASKKFTNKSDLDVKIREKVVAALLENFQFIPLNKVETDDVVVVDDNENKENKEEVKVSENIEVQEELDPEVEAAPSRDLQEARAIDLSKDLTLRRQALVEARQDLPNARMYEDMLEASNRPVDLDDLSDLPDLTTDGITPQEAKAFFGGSTIDPEIQKKAEELKKLAPRMISKKLSSVEGSVSGKNRGIARRE